MVSKATSKLKVNAPAGFRPSLENCRIGDLQIDESYQRSIDNESSKALIRKIAVFWDWSLFQPLTVARRGDGTLWVVDGQHRLAAARLRHDLYDLPCIVTRYDSASDEAASFVAMNMQRRALSALDLFRAAVAAGDGSAREITEMLDRAGLTLAPHQNYISWKPLMISNIGGIRQAHRKHGAKVAQAALLALARAFPTEVLRYGGTIFAALVEVLAELTTEPGFDFELFVEVLNGAPHSTWASEINVLAAKRGMRRPAAGLEVFREAYSEAAGCDEAEAA